MYTSHSTPGKETTAAEYSCTAQQHQHHQGHPQPSQTYAQLSVSTPVLGPHHELFQQRTSLPPETADLKIPKTLFTTTHVSKAQGQTAQQES